MFSSEVSTDLQCSICFRRFHDPIILDCGHTFDRSCIEIMINTNKSFRPVRPIKCPLCNYVFDPEKSLIANKSLTSVIKYEATFECFLIDISSEQQRTNVITFLKTLFNKKDIFDNNHITFETNDGRIIYNSTTNFDQELKIKSLSNLENILHEICIYSLQQTGRRKICILTDGLTKHSNLSKVNSDMIHQRFIIQIGDKNIKRTRKLADKINFHFGYFNEKTLESYVQHFITNF